MRLNNSGRSDVLGLCGSSCEGVEGVDTIGVYEFDSVTETVVGTHVMKEGTGGDPYPSPDGSKLLVLNEKMATSKDFVHYCYVFCLTTCFDRYFNFILKPAEYIVLLAANGGRTVRILEAGNPSEASVSSCKLLCNMGLVKITKS